MGFGTPVGMSDHPKFRPQVRDEGRQGSHLKIFCLRRHRNGQSTAFQDHLIHAGQFDLADQDDDGDVDLDDYGSAPPHRVNRKDR